MNKNYLFISDRNQYSVIIFDESVDDRLSLENSLNSTTVLQIDQSYCTIKCSPNLSGSDHENFKSNCENIKKLFQSNDSAILLFIIHLDDDQTINIESIITFQILNEIYEFDSRSFLFIIDNPYSNPDPNCIKKNLEKLLNITNVRVCFTNIEENSRELLIQSIRNCTPTQCNKDKVFSCTHEQIITVKKELEKKQNSLINLLKEINIKVEENGDLCKFFYKDIRYGYDNEKNALSCSNDQGIKLLNKKEFGILKYLLRRDALFNKSKKINEELEKGNLDQTIQDYLTKQNEHIQVSGEETKKQRLEEINEMIAELETDVNENIDERKRQLKSELADFEQCLNNIGELKRAIMTKKEQIYNLSQNIADENRGIQENDENLNDLLKAKVFQFIYKLEFYQAQQSKELQKDEYKTTVYWDRFNIEKEKKDVNILEQHLESKRNASHKLKNSLETEKKEVERLEQRNNDLLGFITKIEIEISNLNTKSESIDNEIKKLKENKEKFEEERKAKIRRKKAEKIFVDVGGSNNYDPNLKLKSRPHRDCLVTPGVGYCHYIGAVEQAIEFVSNKLDSAGSINEEETKKELLEHLCSTERYPHSVADIKNGKHTKDLEKVVDETIKKLHVLRDEAEKIKKEYDEKIKKIEDEIKGKETECRDIKHKITEKLGNLSQHREEIAENASKIATIKENIRYIESGIKHKKEIISFIEEKKKIFDIRLRFVTEYNEIKQKDIDTQITSYEHLLLQINKSDPCPTFLKDQYQQQIDLLKEYRNCLAEENKDKQADSKRKNPDASSNIEDKSNNVNTTLSSLEDKQKRIEQLKVELDKLNCDKEEAERNLKEKNVIHKFEVTKRQLNYLESLVEIQKIQEKSILLSKSSLIHSLTHYGFSLRGRNYAYPLPDPKGHEQAQQDAIRNINRLLEHVDSVDKYLIQLQAERQTLDQLNITLKENKLTQFKDIEKFLMPRFIRLSGCDQFNHGETLSQIESFISVLIAEILDRSHLYEIDGFNPLDPIIERGLVKILMKLEDHSDLSKALSEVNSEYSDEGHISQVTIFEIGKQSETLTDLKVQNRRELFLFKQDDLYFVLKHDQTMKLIENENLNFKLNINKILSDLANETDLLEDLCQRRITYAYKQKLHTSNELTRVYQNEIEQFAQIYSVKEFNAIFSSYTNQMLFYFLSNVDENLDKFGLKLNQFDSEFEEISNSSLIKIKDLYKTAIVRVLLREQERRKQIRVEKITENENEEIHLTNLILQDEESEKQLLEKFDEKREEISKIEADLNQILGTLNQSEEIYKKRIEDLENKQINILAKLDSLKKALATLSEDMIRNEVKIREIKEKVENLQIQSEDIAKNIEETQKKLNETIEQKSKLSNEKNALEIRKGHIIVEKEDQEKKLEEKKNEINQNEAWKQFLRNLNRAFLDEQIYEKRQPIFKKIYSVQNLSELYNILREDEDLKKILFENLKEKYVDDYVNNPANLFRDEISNLHIKLKQLAKSFIGPLNGDLVSELGKNIKGDSIQIKKYRISTGGNVSYREVHRNVKDTIEREIKCRTGSLYFDNEILQVSTNGINSFDDLPQEIRSLANDRIKIKYQQHEWNNRFNKKYNEAVNQFNELKIDYRQFVCCYVDQIEILCGGSFLLDTSEYYPGIDLIVRTKQMKCGNKGESVKLVTTGSNAPEFEFKQASDGRKKRDYIDVPGGHSGYDGEFGRHGQHAGNIFIKIDGPIEGLDLLESIELSGGKGGDGQLGGNGDKGRKGKDGENGTAEDTRGFAGGQTTFGLGQAGTKSGDGGSAGFSGRGGRGGQPGNLRINDRQGDLFERIRDRVQRNEGSSGKDPDLSGDNASKGGEGGDPTIVGMDQVKNKRSVFHRTKPENGEIDIPYLLEKNPRLREEVEKNSKFGNRGLSTTATVAFMLFAPAILAPLPLLINRTIAYRMSKSEDEYKQNPRRDKNTKGKSKENETSRFRQETENESQSIQRDFTNTSNLDRSLLEKSNEFSEAIGNNSHQQRIDQLNLEKKQFENSIADFKSQEEQLKSDVESKEQTIAQLETEINQYQNSLTELRTTNLELNKQETLNLTKEVKLMTNQQELRDKRNAETLSQQISMASLEKHLNLHGQYQQEYNQMKESLNRYKEAKELLLRKKKEEEAHIEKELARLTNNLRENRKKLNHSTNDKLKLMKDEIILSEDLLQKTQEEVQHEHEHEIHYQLDQDIDIDIPKNRKPLLNQIESLAFTPFARKLTNDDQNREYFQSFPEFNKLLNNTRDDEVLEEKACVSITADINKMTQKETKIEEFNPYPILMKSLELTVEVFNKISDIELSDIEFDLNQIERFYRGIHYSCEININQLNENIRKMQIANDDFNNSELNKVFLDFMKRMQLITIEKFLDKRNEQTRNNLLTNLNLVSDFLNRKSEELLFSYLDKDFFNQLSDLKENLGDFNNTLLINIENGLRNIKERRFFQQINILDDVEQVIAIFDLRRLFRLECSSIDFHHYDSSWTPLELEMLEFNEGPTFEKLISLVTNFQNTLAKKQDYFYGRSLKSDRNFFEVIIHNFDHFAKDTIELELLKKFEGVIDSFSTPLTFLADMRRELLKKIRNKFLLNELIISLREKDYLPKNCQNIVNKLLSTDVHLDESKKQILEEKINKNQENNAELVYNELLSLINHPGEAQVKSEQVDEELNERNEDMKFIEEIKSSIKNKFQNDPLENTSLSSIENLVETTILQVFSELYDTYDDKSTRSKGIESYKQQVRFIFNRDNENLKKCLFMFQTLCQESYFYENSSNISQTTDSSQVNTVLFDLDYSYHSLRYELENSRKLKKTAEYVKELERIKCSLLKDTENHCRNNVKQISDRLYKNLKDTLFRLKVKNELTANNINTQINLYLQDNKQSKDEGWSQCENILSEILTDNFSHLTKNDELLEKFFGDIYVKNDELFRCLLNSCGFQILPNAFEIIRRLRKSLYKHQCSNDFQEILLIKYFQVCEYNTASVIGCLNDLSGKLDKLDDFENAVYRGLLVLNSDFNIDINEVEFYSRLKELINEVQSHYERQLQFADQLQTLQPNGTDSKHIDDVRPTDTDIENIKKIRFSYKHEEKLFDCSTTKMDKDWLIYLRFAHNSITTDEVLDKMKRHYIEEIESFTKKRADEQLEEFFKKHAANENDDKQTKFLNLLNSRNDKLLPELFYHLKTSIRFEFEHVQKLSDTINQLNSSNQNGQFDELIILLEEYETSLFVNLIESLYKPIFEKQSSCELKLSNRKKNIMHQYELNLQSQNKQYHQLQKKFIELSLEKFEKVFNEDKDDLFYQNRIEIFDRLAKDIENKNNDETEQILGSQLNQRVFENLKANTLFEGNIIDSNRSVTIPDRRRIKQKSIFNRKKLDYFFDERGRFSSELDNELKRCSVEVNVNNQKQVYDFSWTDADQFDEIYPMINHLYASHRIELFRKAIESFRKKITRENLIEIIKQSAYLFRSEGLIALKPESQISVIIKFIKDFHSIIVDAMFPDQEDQLILSDFLDALNFFETFDIDLRKEIDELRVCLKYKIYKEHNYVLVEREYEEFIEKRQQNAFGISFQSTVTIVENILYLMDLLEDSNKPSFFEGLKKDFPNINYSEKVSKKDLEDIEKMLNNKKDERLTPVESNDASAERIDLAQIHESVHMNHQSIECLKNRKGYEKLLDYIDEIWKNVENKDKLNGTLYKIIDENFNADLEKINESNLHDVLHTFDVLPLDYLYRKKSSFSKLFETVESFNNDDNKEKYLTNLIRYCFLFCSLDENELESSIRFHLTDGNQTDILVKCLKEIINNTIDIRFCDKQPNPIVNTKEILLVKDNGKFEVFYPKDEQRSSIVVDDNFNVGILSSLCFDRNQVSRETFEKNCKLVYEMVRMKGGEISVNFDKNRIIEHITSSSNQIDVQVFCNYEEKRQLDWILSFAKENNQTLELEKIFSKPVLSWLEELNALKIELVKRKILEQISIDDKNEIEDRFHDSIKFSQFFAKDCINDWFEIIVKVSRSNLTKISLTDLTKIISSLSDIRDLSIVKKLLTNTESHSWLYNILFLRIESNLKIMLRGNLGDDLENRLSHLKGKLKLPMDPKCFFLDVFGQLILECEDQESKLLENNFKRFLIEFIDLIIESRIDLDEQLLKKLSLKPLSLWKLPIEKKVFFKNLEQIHIFQHAFEIDQSTAVDYLYKIREEKGNEILENLLDLIKKIPNNECTLNKLNELLEELTFGGFTLDKGSLEAIRNKPFDQWEDCLKTYTEQQHYELNIDQLIEAMKEKVGEGKINESIKNLLEEKKINNLFETIYSFCGERFNQEENTLQSEKKYSSICTPLSNKVIKDWTKADIRQWADILREEKRSSKTYFDLNEKYLPEIMAVIIRAVKIYHGYHPRNIQLIALAIFLQPTGSAKGRLGNISTGEGKSLITAMLAVSRALIGDRVDIVTSSKVLAVRDASDDPDEGYKKFFALFGLNVSNNCDDDCDNPKTGQALRKERYQENQIIYGETGYFQRDILLTKFFGKDIRDRIGDILIVDEVDNMFIDNAEKILYISHNIADMRHLRDLFIQIWVSVNNRVEQFYSEENVEKIHKYIKLMIKNKDLQIPRTLTKFIDINLKTWITNAYTAKYIESNDSYIIGDIESTKHGEILIMDKDTGVEQMNTRWSNGLHQFLQLKHCGKLSDESLKAVFISNMNFFKLYDTLNGMSGTVGDQEERKLLTLEYGTDCFELPRFRKYRFRYEKRKEFVGRNESEWFQKIVEDIRDKMKSTREIGESERKEIEKIRHTSQSLLDIVNSQLKDLNTELNDKIRNYNVLLEKINKLKTEKKSLTKEIQNSSVSDDENKSEKYYDKLQKCEIEMNRKRKEIDEINQDINSLKEVIVFHQTQHMKLEKNIRDFNQILSDEKRDNRRAVLIICEKIADLEKIAAKVRQEFQQANIYTYDRAYRKFEKNILTPGDIIIATNIAGRGTDLGIDKVLETNGGLHVILSYIPANLRVHQQAFGRTARAGKRGTGTYIVYDSRKMVFIPDMTVDFLLNERDEKEKERLDEIVKKSFPKIKIENILFEEFNLFKDEIKLKIQENLPKTENHFFPGSEVLREVTESKLVRPFRWDNHDIDFNMGYFELQLNSLQNHWAFWLNEMDEKLSKVYVTGSDLILEKLTEFKERMLRELDFNTYGLITEPAELIKLSKLLMDKKKYREAQDCYSQIIKDHPEFSEVAHYYNAFCIIHLGSGDRDAKIKAKVNLKKALSLLESKRNTVMSRNQILLSLNHITRRKGQALNVNYFKKQNEGEAQILSHHINAILEAIGSEINSDSFRCGTITGDNPTKIYEEILKDDFDLIKDTRISKKIIIGSKVLIESTDEKWKQIPNANMTSFSLNKDDLFTYEKFSKLGFPEIQYRTFRNELQQLGILSPLELYQKNRDCILFPNSFKYCQEEVLNALEEVLNKSQKHNWTFKKRIIKENFFETKVFHKDLFLAATDGFVRKEEMIRITEQIRDELVGKLDDPVFCGLGDDIKRLLLGKTAISLSDEDRINRNTVFKIICEKMGFNNAEKEVLDALLSSVFEEKIQIGTQISETLKQNIEKTILVQKTLQLQEVIHNSLSGNDKLFPLSIGDIIKKTTFINTIKSFPHGSEITDEQILNILKYLEFNEKLRINENLNEKFDDSTNDKVFCGKRKKIKKFFLEKESYTLTSGETVCLESNKNPVSKCQLTEVMKEIGIKDDEKINDIFTHLALEFHSVKFIHSYTELYLDNRAIEPIKNYLSKISLLLTDQNREEIKSKIDSLTFVQIGSLHNKSKLIKKTLLKAIEYNDSDLTKEKFGLSKEEFELLRAVLQDNDIFESTLYELLSKSYGKSSFDTYKAFYANLENILITLYDNNGRISEENLALRTANDVSKELFYRLRESNVIKGAKVYFKFTGDPEKRIEDIRKQIEDVVAKVFKLKRKDDLSYDIADRTGFGDFVTSKNKELDEYIDSISNILKQCAGVFRTLPKVKISEKNLKTMFQTGQIPPEIMDYVATCFDSVLSLTEAKSFWNWDAFCCAMLGVAQIVAGVALDVCTCGAAHYFAQVLISEGIGDIIFAIQSGIQGNFSWKAYCQHKVQSLIISLLTAGVGSYLSKGAQAGKATIALATKAAILKAIAKETMTHLITGVASAIVSISTDELSQFLMKELLDKHFEKILDGWIANDAIYKSKRMILNERFESIYKKFDAEDAKNIINKCIHTTLLDLQQGDLANTIFNKVTQVAHGISGALSNTARILQKNKGKAALLGSIAKVIDKSITGLRLSKNLGDLCFICQRFCEILDKKLLDCFNRESAKSNSETIKENANSETIKENANSETIKENANISLSAKSNSETIKENANSETIKENANISISAKSNSETIKENANISISANISEHIKSMEDQMKTAVKEKVNHDFLKPGIQFILNNAMRPVTEFLTSPFANARGELEEHIGKRADEFIALIEEKEQKSLKKLNSRKIRALEQLGHLINVKDIDFEDLEITVSNLNGESIRELKTQYGDNVRIVIKNGKVFALIPTYKEYIDNIESGVFAGAMHFKLAAETFQVSIETLDPENGFELHKDAPYEGIVRPSKHSNDKSIKVAYIKSKEKGQIDHFAPVIEVNGEYKIVELKQNVDTNDQCFAQTMLFIQQYEKGNIKNIDFDKAYDFPISAEKINEFNKRLAQQGRSSHSMRQVYEQGLTVKYSGFLGGRLPRSRSSDLREQRRTSPRYRERHLGSEGESSSENPFVGYRALRPDEDPLNDGVRPPEGYDPNISASDHVSKGSTAKTKSAFVSASRSIKVAAAWASESGGIVAEIDIPNEEHLPYENRSVFDLTDPNTAEYIFGKQNIRSQNYAKASQEILIKNGVSADKIRKLYEVRKGTRKEYNSLKEQSPDGTKIFITRRKAKESPSPRILRKKYHRADKQN
ncbi:unnamed protein product [Rotaria socialis]|uniref:Uncharacterized protein n=1 Tax=Rotaria socialis TaxID=392032 RepID=A0A820GKA7_9BILA|nr:unnamed protein product [Rotaria socialis]CAF4280149.1 unnamed protein product [Rotaria socialis]